MANDDDTRTPEQLEAYAKEAARCGAEVRQQAEQLLKQADQWDKIAADSRHLAAQRASKAEPRATANKPARGGKR